MMDDCRLKLAIHGPIHRPDMLTWCSMAISGGGWRKIKVWRNRSLSL
uniref:Uncharacterized protein n=1 Tax=Arundo donax TaxID=35708 RepID=A0A0A9AW11_ARUDO